MYETGSRDAGAAIKKATSARGGVTRVVLSHAHPDDRGGAPQLGAPIYCHADVRPGAEGDGSRETCGYPRLPSAPTAAPAASLPRVGR